MSDGARGGESPDDSRVVQGVGGLPMVRLRAADGATADVYLHGAHVTSWRPAPGNEERLFLSSRSEFRPGAAIRGGIPVIFPQFAAEGPLPRHGFVRTTGWALEAVERAEDGRAAARLSLADSPAMRAVWPVAFRAGLSVEVGGDRLVVALSVENTGSSAFAFTCALHTYLRVRDVADAAVVGLHGVRYRESSAPTVLRADDAAVVRVTGELDRVYVDVPRSLAVRERGRTLGVTFAGFPDAVLWNPGAERAAALPDMESGGERRMLCVEAAAVQRPVALAPGERWTGAQTLRAEAGSDGR